MARRRILHQPRNLIQDGHSGRIGSPFDERDLIDFLQRGDSRRAPFRAPIRAGTSCPSSRAARRISEAGPLVENHFANLLAQIQQFVDRAAAAESGAAAFEAAGAFVKRDVAPFVQVRVRSPSDTRPDTSRRFLQCGQITRTSRCARMQFSAETKLYGSTPMFRKRPSTSSTLLAWTVVNTRWPVSAALMAICAVSWSRISPTMILSGSWRRIERRPRAKVSPFFSFTGICVMPLI